ncbi:MAG TPA: penicillin-binding transpeptidase domain-containing protein [Gaiellaceae bacterium]|nr:penicillin-binding transpeptidase domain-containing protein [Gaiellaceae bacterium]
MRLPRSLPQVRPVAEPISSAHAGFFGGAGFYVRVGILAAVAISIFGFLALRLWSLQVLQGPRYAHQAARQTFRYVDLPAPRAPIVDVKGRPLAGTQGRLVVTADPETLGKIDAHGRWHPSPRGRELLGRLGRLTGDPTGLLVRRLKHSVLRSPYAPAIVVPHLKRPLSQFLNERSRAFPGLHVAAYPARLYPQGNFGTEFLGLNGEINPDQLHDRRYPRAKPGEIVGQSGVEAIYDRWLNGGLVRNRVAVDSLGRAVGPLRPLSVVQPRRGLQLTIDAKLQRVAERAIRDGIALAQANGRYDARAGAAVVMNPHTGAILALASYPTFNQLAAANDPDYLARLFDQKNSPLLVDRATQGIYPTGSTFKPIVAEAALSTGLLTPYSSLPCTPTYTVGDTTFKNVDPFVNAMLSLPEALTVSCDTWFYRVGYLFYLRQASTGAIDMQRWARLLGVGHTTGLDLPGEAGGAVPTPGNLKRLQPSDPIWYPGQSVNLSIGQGLLQVTPLQLAVAYSAFANGGTVVRPHVARALLTPRGDVAKLLRFPPRRHLYLKDLWAIREGLYNAANAPNGTSFRVFGGAGFPIKVVGKTGTAQAPPGNDHSWYASWAPAGNPKVVVVVVIEHGGFGAEAAAPAAREIYSEYFGLGKKFH